MPSNNRVYFAVEQVGFAKLGTQTFTSAHGVSSIGVNTNYDLINVFEVGQLSPYELIEQLPNVEVTMEKVLDGYPLLCHLATNGSTVGSLAGRSNKQTIFGMTIFDDTQNAASGTPIAELQCSGAFWSRSEFNFNVDDTFKETIGLVGNNKVWKTSGFAITGDFDNTDFPAALAGGSGGCQVRANFKWDSTATTYDTNSMVNAAAGATRGTILPPDIPGISSSGTNPSTAAGNRTAHVRSVRVATDLGREAIFELGHKGPYHRYVTFPVEVTTDIEVTAHTGDLVSATEAGVVGNGDNLTSRTIKIATDEGLFIDLGKKNKLNSISMGGGDVAGANATYTFSYRTFNDFLVQHPSDVSGANLS